MNTLLSDIRQSAHARCIVCSADNERGFKLAFEKCRDGGVTACFACSKDLQGYDGMLHGGVISALLDGAMTNCLFAHGIKALTVELKVRFLLPVDVGNGIQLQASIERIFSRFYLLRSKLLQNGMVKARGSAKFLKMPRD